MIALPKAFLEEIRARVPLSDVIGKRTKIIRAGREFKACCPFHKEKSPSFTINDQKGFYHCFGCGAHGDVVRFVMEHDNLKFMEAVEQLAAVAGMQVPKPTAQEAQKFQQQMSMYDMMDMSSKWFEAQLYRPENKKALRYLLDRGLSLETIKAFRLGYAPDNANELKALLEKAKFSNDDIISAGLFRKSERNQGDIYPFFRHRVMFPVSDTQGRIVAFGGRIMNTEGGDKSAPKYINSPETEIFHKGKNLYGLSHARKPIGDGETVVVVEGYMDVIALHQAGFRGAVAPLGTALTESQVEVLWRVMPEENRYPILCFDGDSAGQRAAERSLDRVMPILKPDHSVKFAFLPEKHDPDSLIKEEGRSAMERVLKSAIGLFDMLWQVEAKQRNLAEPEMKAGFRRSLEMRVKQIADSSVQQFFLHEVNQKIEAVFLSKKSEKSGWNMATPWKKSVYAKGKNQQPTAHTPYRGAGQQALPIKNAPNIREKILLAVMIHYPELYDEFAEAFGQIKMTNNEYDKLRHELINFYSHPDNFSSSMQNHLDYQAVKQHLSENGFGEILSGVFDSTLYLHASFAKPSQPLDVVRQGWLDTWERGLVRPRTT